MDEELIAENPRLLRRAFELIIQRGVNPPEQILSDLGLLSPDVQELSCTEEGLFQNAAHSTTVAIKESDNNKDLGITTEYMIVGDLPKNLN